MQNPRLNRLLTPSTSSIHAFSVGEELTSDSCRRFAHFSSAAHRIVDIDTELPETLSRFRVLL